jgi:hypothetical protein
VGDNDRNHISKELKMKQPKIIVGRVVAAAITAAALGGTLALASPASAALDRYVEVVGCNQPPGQQKCPTVPSVTFDHEGAPGVRIAFTANSGHCSDIIANIIVDGMWVGGIVVGPGERDGGIVVPLAAGSHTIGVQGEGMTGGCNTGRLDSWGGTLHVEDLT